MLSVIFPPLVVGALTVSGFVLTTLAAFSFLLPAILLKLMPLAALQRACSRYCVAVATQWVSINRVMLRVLHAEAWDLDLRGQLDPRRNYLLICNHQSWVDIVLLFDLLHGRVPFPRFFLKWELMYVPVIGLACWAMDFPFMRRHSREQIAARPELKSQDLAATRRACEIYRTEPVTIINFLEGTRFTPAKHAKYRSPFRHLLRPKAGGASFTLNAMGEQLDGLIDVTIAYRPTNKPLLWSFACGEQNGLSVHLDLRPIPAELMRGDYENDAEFRERFQTWVNGLWTQKDARLERLINTRPAMQAPRLASGH